MGNGVFESAIRGDINLLPAGNYRLLVDGVSQAGGSGVATTEVSGDDGERRRTRLAPPPPTAKTVSVPRGQFAWLVSGQ